MKLPERLARRLVSWSALPASLLISALGRTWRFRVVAGGEHLEALRACPRPVIPTFWHRRLVPCSVFVQDSLGDALAITYLVSQSRDGELAAGVVRRRGGRVVRGSASRGGRDALRALYRAIRRDGASPVMTPDGPRGPVDELKVGTVVLAQTTGAPLLPLAASPDRSWTLRSWDRLLVPKPFAKIAVAIGEPLAVPRSLTDEEAEAERRRAESTLNALVERARQSGGS